MSVFVCVVYLCVSVWMYQYVRVCMCVLAYATQMLHMWNFNSESIRTQLASSQIIDEQGIISSPV